MKKLKKSEMLSRGQVEHVKSERNLLAEVDSHFIVKLYYSFQDAEYLYLILEYLPGDDMMNFLIKEETLTETVARFYIAQSILAIESVHKHNYIHRDIKPDNLLLDRDGHMKLSDFGLCKPLDCTNLTTIKENESLASESFSGNAKQKNWNSAKEKLQHWKLNRRTLGEWKDQVPTWENCGGNKPACPDILSYHYHIQKDKPRAQTDIQLHLFLGLINTEDHVLVSGADGQ